MDIGTAGWSIPRDTAEAFPGAGQHLQRYARVFGCTEINTSFYRSHRTETYARWAAMTPPGFRFAVKVPGTITHEGRLRRAREPLLRFLGEVSGLGKRLAVVLVQLPPSFTFEPRQVRSFFRLLGEHVDVAMVCEPRHASWFTPSAEHVLETLRVGRAAADPALSPAAARPGGWLGPGGDGSGAVVYHRWHGSPRMYWSDYAPEWLAAQARALSAWPARADPWVIFDNTARGAATANALALGAMLRTG